MRRAEWDTVTIWPAHSSHSFSTYACKRPLDLLGAVALLILSTPLWLVTALLVKLTSSGPVFFRQERIGLNGRPFTMVKFRTMYHGADETVHQRAMELYMQGKALEGQPDGIFKLHRDPRITPLGGVLRRLGIDELPQLINVVRGDMSLVGPRPPLGYEVAQYDDRHRQRLNVKPGLTGLWQVRGRDTVEFESMIDMDLEYIARQSLWLDLGLMVLTPFTLLRDYLFSAR